MRSERLCRRFVIWRPLPGSTAARPLTLVPTLHFTGPYKINGVPLRRINQAYVIATSTTVDVSAVKVGDHVNDAYFQERVEGEAKDGEDAFFAGGAASVNQEWLTKRKEDQKAVDTAVLKAVAAVPALRQYLNAKFSLKNGQAPHLMKF